jgi:hypothetical protein
MLNRLTENQCVPRPQFGDASIVYDSDGLIKYVDGNDGEKKFIYPTHDLFWVFPEAELRLNVTTGASAFFGVGPVSTGPVADVRHIANGIVLLQLSGNSDLSKILGVNQLTKLKNIGTGSCVILSSCNFSTEGINEFFTELPVTTNIVTIDFRYNPGSATCDPSIATNKGYTVVV